MEFEASIEIAALIERGGTSWSTWSGGQSGPSRSVDRAARRWSARCREPCPHQPAQVPSGHLDGHRARPGRSLAGEPQPGPAQRRQPRRDRAGGASVARLTLSQSGLLAPLIGLFGGLSRRYVTMESEGVAAAGRGVGRVTFEFGPDLRERLRRNLARHERWEVPVGDLGTPRSPSWCSIATPMRMQTTRPVRTRRDGRGAGDGGTRARRERGRHRGRTGGAPRGGGRCGFGRILPNGRCRAAGSTRASVRWTRLRRELHEAQLDLPESALLGVPTTTPRGPATSSPSHFWGGADPRAPQPGRGVVCSPPPPRAVPARLAAVRVDPRVRPMVVVPVGGDLIHAPTGAGCSIARHRGHRGARRRLRAAGVRPREGQDDGGELRGR